MTKFIPKVIRGSIDAIRALVEVIGEATLPAPKRIPVKVTAGKGRR